MDFYGEEIEKEKKMKKTSKIILIFIVFLIIAVIAIICAILYLNSSKFRVIIDGKTISNIPEDLFIIDEQNGKVYVSIKDFTQYTNTVIPTEKSDSSTQEENPYAYTAHIGEYKLDVQDVNKCYIENNYETASFFLNSNKICKLEKDSSDDYDTYTIKEPVKDINGKMYILSEGIEIAFNLKFYYNQEQNNITITTLPYILSQYSSALVNSGFVGTSEDFNNQKAVLYNLFVVQKSSGSSSNNSTDYGVVTWNGEKFTELISTKYKKIEFNENREEFFVTNSSDKVGIFLSTGATKVNPSYDEIKMIDPDYGLYLVKSNNKYGVINDKEVKIVHLEYDAIGIDATNYTSNEISNQYLLYDNIIPVKQNNKWGLFNRSGEKILEVECDSIGCIASTVKDKVANNLLLIPDIEGIVISKDKKYGLIDSTGKELIPCATDVMYSITDAGVDTYYMNYTIPNPNAEQNSSAEKTITYNFNIIEYLVTNKIIADPTKKNVTNQDENQDTTNTVTTNTTNESESNNVSNQNNNNTNVYNEEM